MQHKKGDDRNQIFMFSLDSVIASNSIVRVLDAIVDASGKEQISTTDPKVRTTGREKLSTP